jgi:excisionase family DNA binding protein
MQYMTIKTLALYVGLSEESVRRDILRGNLNGIKTNGVRGYRIPVDGSRGVNHYIRKKFPALEGFDVS